MGNYNISTQIELPFELALIETRNALAAEQFLIVTEIDLQRERFGRMGRQTRPHTLLDVCVRSWDYRALKKEPEIALLMSCSLRLEETEQGKCTLATADLMQFYQESGEESELAKAARAIDARLRAVVASVQHAELATTPVAVQDKL